jgi:excisionase family DNA binding protein
VEHTETNAPPGPWLTLNEGASYSRLGRRTLQRLIQQKRSPAYKPVGNRVLLRREDLDRLVMAG